MGIYLDYNATTPIDERVLTEMVDVYRNSYGNADSRTHDYGENARKIVDKARERVANLLSVDKGEVFFTSGSTESSNIAIQGLKSHALKTGKKHVITSAIEHKAVLSTVKSLEDDGFEVKKHVGLVETPSAKDKKQHLLDVWFGRVEAETRFCVETTIEPDDEWLHAFYYFNDEIPSVEDFERTMADYLTFEFNMITHGRGYLFDE